jgi:hypothetical protein
MNRIAGWKKFIPVFIAVLAAGGVFLTAQLASGDPTPPPPPDIDSVTPPTPPADAFPKPVPFLPGVPPPFVIGGVEIPIPADAHIAVNTSAGGSYEVILGDSWVFFDEQGTIISSQVAPEHSAAFDPVLAAIEQLGSTAR